VHVAAVSANRRGGAVVHGACLRRVAVDGRQAGGYLVEAGDRFESTIEKLDTLRFDPA
jgi:hypothetical protein